MREFRPFHGLSEVFQEISSRFQRHFKVGQGILRRLREVSEAFPGRCHGVFRDVSGALMRFLGYLRVISGGSKGFKSSFMVISGGARVISESSKHVSGGYRGPFQGSCTRCRWSKEV